jgi:hypothetical protein
MYPKGKINPQGLVLPVRNRLCLEKVRLKEGHQRREKPEGRIYLNQKPVVLIRQENLEV